MTTTKTLTPLYNVKLVKDGRYRYYRASALDNSWVDKFHGITGISGMLDDGKSSGFARAAAAIAVAAVRSKLLAFGANPVLLEPDKIEEILSGCAKTYLAEWATKRDRGTDYHALLENRIKGIPFTTNPIFEDIWSKLQNKLKEEGIDLIDSEVPCASLKYRMGTRVDGVGKMMGDYGIIDWKFARFTSSDYAFQLAGGAQCWSETFGIEAKWAKVFRWDFDKSFWEVKTVKDLGRALRGLNGLREVKDSIEDNLYV